VNESKTNPYRYYISYMLRDLPVGSKFKPSELHITILPWFALETKEGPFLEWFYKNFDAIAAFDAVVGEPKMFGPRHDVPVSLIGPKDKFLELHKLGLSWFGELGARWAEKDPYVGDDYLPHVAQRQGYVLEEGQPLRIESISLFKGARQDDHVRIVAAKAHLSES
jgi:hypothetical protein